MRRFLEWDNLLLTVALLVISAPEWPQRPPTGWATDATITNLVDGDTVDVEIRRTVRVRLLECWAPESRTRDAAEKEKGLASKAHLQEIAPVGTPVRLWVPTSGEGDIAKVFTMGRALGHVWPLDGDGRSLSQQQVESGHALREDPRGRHAAPVAN